MDESLECAIVVCTNNLSRRILSLRYGQEALKMGREYDDAVAMDAESRSSLARTRKVVCMLAAVRQAKLSP